jgi:putative transcriptional regulator
MPGPTQSWQGQLLLDGGKLHGSFFHRAVVLICQHDAGGAFGLILNRPAGSKVGEAVVANLPEALKEQPLYLGGPVQPGVLSFLHSDKFVPHANVMPELNLGHSIEALMDLSETYSTTQKLRLFAGYAGWSPGQLEQEMARHDWLTHPATVDLVFKSEPAQLWKEILRQKDPKLRWLADSPENLSWN